MELMGLGWGQLAALFGAASVLVTALYLLKLRRRRVVVPFVGLWERLLADKQASSLFSQLKRLWSLLLALLLIALLALALGDPRPTEDSGTLRHRVVLIDAGITMQAREDNQSRLQVALEHARHLIDAMGATDRMLIAQVDRSVTPLSPMTDDATQLLAALKHVHATDVRSDLSAGIALAHDVLRGRSRPEVVLLSDGASHDDALDTASNIPLRHVLIGRHKRDVGIAAFAVRRFPLDKARSELLIELVNLGSAPAAIELRLDGDDKAIDVQRLDLAASERKRLVFDNITGVDRTLRATLRMADGSRDDLPANDRAYATLPERARTRVLCVTEGNRYLEAALLLDEYLQVDVMPPSAYTPNNGQDHDVLIFDRHVPTTPPDRPAIYLYPLATTERPGPLRIVGSLDRPYFDKLVREHPLLRHVALRDVNVSAALHVELEPGDKIIGGDARGPLLVEGQRNGHGFVALTSDVTNSDLPLRVAWPMLLLNALDSFAEQQVGYVDNYRAGERGQVQLHNTEHAPTWTAPDGSTTALPVSEGRAVIDVDAAGIYTLHDGELTRPIAINPAAVERVEPKALSRQIDKPERVGTRTPVGREFPWRYLLMAALLLLAVEWFTFHRRWTV